MKYWIGFASFAGAAWFIYSALLHRRKAQVATGSADAAEEPVHNSLAFARDVFPPIVVFFLFYAGLKACLAYFMFGASGLVSLFDLAGFLVLLAGYGFWFTTRCRYRIAEPAAEPVEADEEAEEPPAIAA